MKYEVVADRDKGDQPVYDDVQTHTDRVTVEQYGQPTERIVRIERVVPTTDEDCTGSDDCSAPRHVHGCFADRGKCSDPSEHPSLPTREQIANVIIPVMATDWDRTQAPSPYRVADAVLALLKGGDR